MFNSYDRLYTLEADTTARFKIIVCAVDWCKKLSANYSVAPLVRHLIEQYASKYKSLKTTLLQTIINGPQARMDRLLPPIEPPLLILSSFKHELDAEMLGKFTLNF
ncbi:hypothetical protein [Candidatus Paracaedibacter symbiosus]|uniref:hypothetical protein n=1 Tax=Candidatus Paracaedibacter symbiosus TaxID=244582 RepID=UPI000509A992|nr:hypothetical protein [Candidatus Paracaedibacter symbiosus]